MASILRRRLVLVFLVHGCMLRYSSATRTRARKFGEVGALRVHVDSVHSGLAFNSSACQCAATSGNKHSCCSSTNGAGQGTGDFCGSDFSNQVCGGDTPVCCTSDGESKCCKQGSTCSVGCLGGGSGGKGVGGCGCVDATVTPACPNPVSLSAGTGCMCTSTSCGIIPEVDIDKLHAGQALVITSQGVPGETAFMKTDYVSVSTASYDLSPDYSQSLHRRQGSKMDATIDPTIEYQTILGFGGAFTDATAYNFEKLDAQVQKQWTNAYFGKTGAGFTIGRVNMNGCDCSRMDYTYDNVTGDYDLEHFCLRDDSAPEVPCGTDYKMTPIKAAQEAVALADNGKLKLFASSWSAPLWYKDQRFKCTPEWQSFYPTGVCVPEESEPAIECNRTTTWAESGATDSNWVSSVDLVHSNSSSPAYNARGNCYLTGFLKEDEKVLKSWALYFTKFIDAYKAEGIDMWGVTVQNEPLATTSLWPAMFYTQKLYTKFLANHLGPTMREQHPDVKIMIYDDSLPNIKEFVGEVLRDNIASKYVDGVAFHWYGSMNGFYENTSAMPLVKAIVQQVANPSIGNWARSIAQKWFGTTIPSIGGGADLKDVWSDLQKQSLDKFLLGSEASNGAILGDKNGLFGPSPGNWGYGYAYSHNIMWSLLNNAAGWTDWNLMLDDKGGPNGWGNFLMPSISYSNKSSFVQQPQFFHLAHFSKYVVPGSKRVELSIVCGAKRNEYCQAVAFLTPKNLAVVIITNDEITESPLSKVPVLTPLITPALAKGEHGPLDWTIRCKTSQVTGTIPWKGIQTIVMPC